MHRNHRSAELASSTSNVAQQPGSRPSEASAPPPPAPRTTASGVGLVQGGMVHHRSVEFVSGTLANVGQQPGSREVSATPLHAPRTTASGVGLVQGGTVNHRSTERSSTASSVQQPGSSEASAPPLPAPRTTASGVGLMEQDTLSARSCAAWGPGSVGGGIQESGSALSALSGGRGSGVGVSVGGHVLGWDGSQAGGAGPAAAVSGRAKGGVGGRVPVRSGVQPSPGTGVGALNANGGRGGGRPARTLSGGRGSGAGVGGHRPGRGDSQTLSGGRGGGAGVGGQRPGRGGSQARGAGPAAPANGRGRGGVQPSPGTGVGALNASGGNGVGRPARARTTLNRRCSACGALPSYGNQKKRLCLEDRCPRWACRARCYHGFNKDLQQKCCECHKSIKTWCECKSCSRKTRAVPPANRVSRGAGLVAGSGGGRGRGAPRHVPVSVIRLPAADSAVNTTLSVCIAANQNRVVTTVLQNPAPTATNPKPSPRSSCSRLECHTMLLHQRSVSQTAGANAGVQSATGAICEHAAASLEALGKNTVVDATPIFFNGINGCPYAGLTACISQARAKAFLSEVEETLLLGMVAEAKDIGVYPVVQLGEWGYAVSERRSRTCELDWAHVKYARVTARARARARARRGGSLLPGA
ncbi:unnamed protein product [Ectocarpus sp. 12 AP-2014]